MNTRIVTTTSSQTPWQGAERSSCVRSSKPVSAFGASFSVAAIPAVFSEKKAESTSTKKQASRPVRPMNARSAFIATGFSGGCCDTQEGDPRSAAW